ncbi:MAG: EAL domain-containing protein [Gemmatimonadota bacterium]|nr:EAL domain-containing protein [Gemmatimonadota bacterium]
MTNPPAGAGARNEGFFRALLENASDVVALVSADGTIAYVSPAVELVLGHDPESQVGRNVFAWVHPEDVAQVVRAFTAAARGAAAEGVLPFRVQHRDGSWRVLEATATNRLSASALEGIVLTARDVTERRYAQIAHRQLREVLDGTPDFVFTFDPSGRILYVNGAARHLLGLIEPDIARFNFSDFYPPWASERMVTEAIPGALQDGDWRGELALLEPEGRECLVSQVLVAHRTEDGATAFLSVTARDITEGKRAESALRESEERFRQMAENIEEVFWLVDRSEWRVLFVSAAYETVWGRSCESLHADPGSLLRDIHPDDRAEGAQTLEEFFVEGEREYRIVRPDGELRWIRSRSFAVRNADGADYRVAGISEDITQRKERDEHLRHMALNDSLTALPNRTSLLHRLKRALVRLDRQPNSAFTLLFVDLDRFKLINDSLGHIRGDEVLMAIARRLETCVRPEDMVARLGGDEFAILLHQTSRASDAARVADRILSCLQEPFTVAEHEVFVGVSIGIVPSGGYSAPEDILRDADIAMYRAKVGGRGTYRVFDGAMHAEVVSRLQMETDLRRALERGEFVLYYQPIILLATGEISGVEVLLRWQHPTRGQIMPTDFIGVTEEIGTIIPLGWWVLREACLQLSSWAQAFPGIPALSVSVNLSARHFSQRGIALRVEEILTETGVDPRRLKLEITETVMIENARAARTTFEELRALGVEICIDDFGTGYSSLSYLDQFPIDTLKIDRTLVARIGPAGDGGEIVRTVVTLAQDLGMRVIAEGIETLPQLHQLRSLGCDLAQGFLFARPLPAAAFQELLAGDPRW